MRAENPDRARQDVGNIVMLEHVNVTVPRQDLATQFYVVGLGLTRDPYLMVGLENMWINVGQQQFHLPTSGPQVMRGTVGLVIPELDRLPARLAEAAAPLEGTRFAFGEEDDAVVATCPWGNRIRCHAPGPRFEDMRLGMAYVEFDVERGCADGIARFYQQVMGAPSRVESAADGDVAHVRVGRGQELVFREVDGPLADYDGHHVAIYISDFSAPYRRLGEMDLVSRENGDYEYRFVDISDPATGKALFRIEHEVRSLTHPIYHRPLINRNPEQRQRTYSRGRDAFA
ncbi:MAG: hypothetical protein H6983_09230 [Ectothiorhodospiraceae bacterium]|nr:hypothetical protein [Chromatiales bacterium]MCP5154334.1 hypothetical protein [Ectothiorhodospiraceae bacterium]